MNNLLLFHMAGHDQTMAGPNDIQLPPAIDPARVDWTAFLQTGEINESAYVYRAPVPQFAAYNPGSSRSDPLKPRINQITVPGAKPLTAAQIEAERLRQEAAAHDQGAAGTAFQKLAALFGVTTDTLTLLLIAGVGLWALPSFRSGKK